MQTIYENMTTEELAAEVARLDLEVEHACAKNLALDMARGKPSPQQVNISRPMLSILTEDSDLTDEGVDCANYGGFEGIPSARKLAGEYFGVPAENTFVFGSSSLTIMHDVLGHLWRKGTDGNPAWDSLGETKFLCPAPGYDRHFRITEDLGMTNVAIPMTGEGPDMDMIEDLVAHDASIKGIWCVPKYSNPTGETYSDETVRRLVSMKCAAPDFRIFWDNAYSVHDLYDTSDSLLNVFDVAREAGNPDRVYAFASTSKITFPGAGMAFMAASKKNLEEIAVTFGAGLISADKMNQLRHVRFMPTLADIHTHMQKHAEFLRPRFEVVEQKLQEGLANTGCARWTHPRGGYFVSFDGVDGSAQRIVALTAKMGVKMTGAGATYPYGKDPHDTNIRIAPSYPSVEDLAAALDVFVLAVKCVSAHIAYENR